MHIASVCLILLCNSPRITLKIYMGDMGDISVTEKTSKSEFVEMSQFTSH